jgi:outer membrane protein assembly factor BamB
VTIDPRTCAVTLVVCALACTPDPPDDPTHEHGELAWYFGSDTEANVWSVTLVDSAAPGEPDRLELDELATLSGSAGNDAGPSWGDAMLSSDGARIFVNATSVDKVAVFDVESGSLEAVLDVGARPVHLYNPNHGDEIWTHADGEGAFYVIDQSTLAVSDPVVAALTGTGHGKLVYAEDLGSKYFATNTNDPGAFVLDGAAKSDGTYIALCGAPCEDDPDSTCGGTHDKAYNPGMGWALFQCSGVSGGNYAFVDAATDEVVQDLVPIAGGIASTPGGEYILVIDGDLVQIWDTSAADHDGLNFDHTLTLSGSPSDRGTEFRQTEAGWEAWMPQNDGTKVIVVDLDSLATEELEIGTLTPPAGAGHFARRSALGTNYFFNANDQGVVMVDLETRELTQGSAVDAVARIVPLGVADEH